MSEAIKTATSLKELSQGRSDLLKIDPRDLRMKEGWNGRETNSADNIAHIEQLKGSIKEVGVKKPLSIYWEDKTAWIEDGHCRLIATLQAIAEGADIKTVPCLVAEKASAEQRVFNQLIHNSGKPLSRIEKATLYQRLLAFGWNQSDIARKEGVTPSTISQCLELAQLPERLKGLVLANKVSSSLAVQTLKKHNGDAALAYDELTGGIEQAESEGASRVLPKHMGEAKEKRETKQNYLTVLKEAFDSSDIDDTGEEFYEIRMPNEMFEKVRELLKL